MSGVPPVIRRVIVLSFGGIGDAILFSPVIDGVRSALPQAEITLVLEDRSAAVAPLLPGVNQVVPVCVQGVARPRLFLKLLGLLRNGNYDAVIATGSSPMIPVLLVISGIPVRVGFDGGPLHRWLLSAAAPLNRKAFAGTMYAALSQAFRTLVLGQKVPPSAGLPRLAPPDPERLGWAQEIVGTAAPESPRILIHPGVSQVSVVKRILKSWPAPSWVQLIETLLAKGCRVYLAGGPDDAEAVQQILAALPQGPPGLVNLYGQTRSLADLAALIASADCLVAVDSSPLHIAVGLGTPVVAMFGPTDERKLLPEAPCFRAVSRSDLSCRPCLWDVRQTSCDAPVCLEVSVDAMMSAVEGVLASRMPAPGLPG